MTEEYEKVAQVERSASQTSTIYPLVAALVKTEAILGQDRTWQASNPQQAEFLATSFQAYRQESSQIPEIESIASWDAEEINRFLHTRGFQIQLSPFRRSANEQEFGVASVLDLLMQWLVPGQETQLQDKAGKTYPGVRLSQGLSFARVPQHANPIACLQTTTHDLVYLTQSDANPQDLPAYIQQISHGSQPDEEYGGIHFPMVELKQEVDLSWLLNMWTTSADGLRARITQALQETRFTMNQIGAHAKSAVAIKMVKFSAISARPRKPDLVIDGPFLIWFTRPGLSKPLFSAYITQADWKDPGQINA
jgi:hypothetical protein